MKRETAPLSKGKSRALYIYQNQASRGTQANLTHPTTITITTLTTRVNGSPFVKAVNQ